MTNSPFKMKFYIEVDNPSLSYTGGDTISGKVHIELGKEERTAGMTISCFGIAEVHWNEKPPDVVQHPSREILFHGTSHHAKQTKEIKRHTSLTAVERYFEFTTLLHGKYDGSEVVMPGSMQTFVFSFDLPNGIPSSFQNTNGTVKYVLEARLERPTKFDYHTNTVFHVNGILDLQKYPGTSKPIEIRGEKTSCCCCCKSGVLGFSFKLNKTGFILGESLGFVVNLFNMSSKKISKTYIQIVQNLSFIAHTTKREYETVLETCGPTLNPGETTVWEGIDIKVPLRIPPTGLGGCKIIGVDYELKMIVQVNTEKTFSRSIPITIGTRTP